MKTVLHQKSNQTTWKLIFLLWKHWILFLFFFFLFNYAFSARCFHFLLFLLFTLFYFVMKIELKRNCSSLSIRVSWCCNVFEARANDQAWIQCLTYCVCNSSKWSFHICLSVYMYIYNIFENQLTHIYQ